MAQQVSRLDQAVALGAQVLQSVENRQGGHGSAAEARRIERHAGWRDKEDGDLRLREEEGAEGAA